MRAVLWIIAACAVLWTGYWLVASRGLQNASEGWFAEQVQNGTASYKAVSVGGFPGRFDLTVTEPRLVDPRSMSSWSAPEMLVTALAYNPWHLIGVFPNQQTIDLPDQSLTVTSAKLLGSLVVAPGTALTLERTRLAGDKIALSSTLGWQLAADALHFASMAENPQGTQHEIGLELLKVSPDPVFRKAVQALPDQIDRIHLDANLTLSAPLDRQAGQTNPAITAIDIKDLSGNWGDLVLGGNGTLTADAMGRAEGRIDLRLANWRKAMPLLVAAGLVTPEVAPTWEKMLDYVARQNGDDPEVLNVPLVYSNGRGSLGPLPLGPAPRLR